MPVALLVNATSGAESAALLSMAALATASAIETVVQRFKKNMARWQSQETTQVVVVAFYESYDSRSNMRKANAEYPNELWAKRFKEARLAAGRSQKQLGLDVGLDDFVASTRVNRYELGVHRADYPMEVRLAKALDVPVAYFYAETEDLASLLIAFHRASKAAKKLALAALAGDGTT